MSIWDYMKKAEDAPAPVSIDRTADRRLRIRWSDGTTTDQAVRDLRANCPCAGCVDEMTRVRTLDVGAIPADVDLAELNPVGNYALQLVFTDGHSTGIFDWKLLRSLVQREP